MIVYLANKLGGPVLEGRCVPLASWLGEYTGYRDGFIFSTALSEIR